MSAFGVVVVAAMAAAMAAAMVAPALADAAEPSRHRGIRLHERRADPVVSRAERFEAGADLRAPVTNPFDSSQATVQAVFRSPTGATATVRAFWFQDYSRALVDGREQLTPRGAPYWKIRFTPSIAGSWWWRWDARTAAGATRGRWHHLQVRRASASHGFLRVSRRDPRYVVHDDGTPYFAIGENLGWYDQRGTFAYDDWLDRLETQGATWVRVWMPSWAMGIEWSDTGLGNYTRRLDRAWQLDYVLDAAAQRGIAVQLVLQNHGAFSTVHNPEWERNPYNSANGGPLVTPAQFFTDPVAESYFRRRVRYIVARYGAATNLLAWELWNEVDLTDGYAPSVSATWHRETAEYVRGIDAARHLVTTSFGYFFDDPVVWEQSGLDLTQIHFYSQAGGLTLFPDLARVVVDWPAQRVQAFGRPSLFAELGVAAAGPGETVAADPEGIGVHDGLWAGAFGGAMGSAMTWWWDNVIAADPARYYPMFGSVARFLSDIAWDREGFVVDEPAVSGTASTAVRAHVLAGRDRVLLWVKDGRVRYDAPVGARVSGARVSLAELPAGRWCAGFWDTWSGGWYWLAVAHAGPTATLAIPPFRRDTAVRMHRC